MQDRGLTAQFSHSRVACFEGWADNLGCHFGFYAFLKEAGTAFKFCFEVLFVAALFCIVVACKWN